MTSIYVIALLLIAAIPLVALGSRFKVPYPVILVLGGLVLGFIPRMPQVQLQPSIVFLIFLPPILYWEAITAPSDEMKRNATRILPLIFGLVLVSAVAVAAVLHAFLPQVPWAVAFVLGAILAPTDETVFVPIAERLQVPRRTLAIVEGESLLNDAFSLVLYVMAAGAVVAGTFSWSAGLLRFALILAGSIVLGVIVGTIAVWAWRRLKAAEIQTLISVVLPFVAYLPADRLGLSGVLSVVVTGLYVNRYTPSVLTSQTRIRAIGYWDTIVFFTNALLFLTLGLQLHGIVGSLGQYSRTTIVALVVALSVTLFIVRFVWVFTQGRLFRLRACPPGEEIWKHWAIATLGGFRGAISLAAALALPMAISSGAPFPYRHLFILVTFGVVVISFVGGGFALPIALRALDLKPDESEEVEVHTAEAAMAKSALDELERLRAAHKVEEDEIAPIRARYRQRLKLFTDGENEDVQKKAERITGLHERLFERERDTLLKLREAGKIDNAQMRKILAQLDMREAERLYTEAHIGEDE